MVGLDHAAETKESQSPGQHLWLCYLRSLHVFTTFLTYLCCLCLCAVLFSLAKSPMARPSGSAAARSEIALQHQHKTRKILHQLMRCQDHPRPIVVMPCNWCSIVAKSGVSFWKLNADKCRIKCSKFLQDHGEIPKHDWICTRFVWLMSSHFIVRYFSILSNSIVEICWVGCVWSLWSSRFLHFVRALSAVLCVNLPSAQTCQSKGTLKRSLDTLSMHSAQVWNVQVTQRDLYHYTLKSIQFFKVFKSQNLKVLDFAWDRSQCFW